MNTLTVLWMYKTLILTSLLLTLNPLVGRTDNCNGWNYCDRAVACGKKTDHGYVPTDCINTSSQQPLYTCKGFLNTSQMCYSDSGCYHTMLNAPDGGELACAH